MSTKLEFITAAQARSVMQERIVPLARTETVPLHEALGRRLAAPVLSPVDVPAYDNSALDGFAFSSREVPDYIGEVSFEVAGESLAGHPFRGERRRNQVVRIMTGAPVPEGLDRVIMWEETRPDPRGGSVSFDPIVVRGRTNVRRRGEDLRKGQEVLPAFGRITPLHVGLLAALGLARVPVLPRLRVAVIATGDELVAAGEPCPENRIYNANGPALTALCENWGFEAKDLGIVRDSEQDLRAAVGDAFSRFDMVLFSGGASQGDADLTQRVLFEEGEAEPWLVKMRPGKPMRFGLLDGKPFFVLPGNPVAALVTAMEFVRYAGLLAQGVPAEAALPQAEIAVLTGELGKKKGREEFSRGRLSVSEDGRLTAEPLASQGAAAVSTLAGSECLFVLSREDEKKNPGDAVPVHRIDALIR